MVTKYLQKGINQLNPTIKVNADVSGASSIVNSFIATVNRKKMKIDTDSSGNVIIKEYANGGLPPVGQLFVANERGPELVGQIGGQSFVANQNQIMNLLDKKIGSSQNNSGNQVYNIYLDKDHKIATYTLNQLQDMAKSNGRPMEIW